MEKIISNDYHDFVIKNGKLIGEFDQMYKKSKQTPWHQDEPEGWLNVRLIREYGPFDYLCYFGSGLGHFLDIFHRELRNNECKLIGYDVSETCCKKGKNLFPKIDFYQLDLMKNGRRAIGF